MSSKEVFCGAGDVPKKQRRGSMKECAEKGQIRYYGVKKVDKRLLDELKKGTPSQRREKIVLEIMKYKGMLNRNTKLYAGEKNKEKKEKFKEAGLKLRDKIIKLNKKLEKFDKQNPKKKMSRGRSRSRSRSRSRKNSKSLSLSRNKSSRKKSQRSRSLSLKNK